MKKNTKIILVRHGETEFNKRKLFFGHLNPKLNEKGISDIKKISLKLKEIKIDFIYSSDLKRCTQTADIINKFHNVPINKNNNLREINFGIFEGKSYEELIKEFPKESYKHFNEWEDYIIPNGESPLELQNRAIKEIEKIINTHPEKTVLISTHSGIIKSVLSYYLCKDTRGFWKFSIDHGSITMLNITSDNFFYVECINRL